MASNSSRPRMLAAFPHPANEFSSTAWLDEKASNASESCNPLLCETVGRPLSIRSSERSDGQDEVAGHALRGGCSPVVLPAGDVHPFFPRRPILAQRLGHRTLPRLLPASSPLCRAFPHPQGRSEYLPPMGRRARPAVAQPAYPGGDG